MKTAGTADLNQMDLNAKFAGARVGEFTDRGNWKVTTRERSRLATVEVSQK